MNGKVVTEFVDEKDHLHEGLRRPAAAPEMQRGTVPQPDVEAAPLTPVLRLRPGTARDRSG